MNPNLPYCFNYHSYKRILSREIDFGQFKLGGNNPVVIQSMTNTNTLDTAETVSQCIKIIEAGGQLIRITAKTIAEAENIRNIKAELIKRGYLTPVSVDVHFDPKIAEIAAQYVEKVRINPGNYGLNNRKSTFTEREYQQELQAAAIRLKPLIEICKKHITKIRIGVNHGSLSKRIVSRYGNSPLGMAESALEFTELFEKEHFFDLVISLKSSNVLTMVHANRILAAKMIQNKKIYPFHLGVTEAGNGIDGRLKSFAGIYTLLIDGIGDTIRVSLTESPENEIFPANQIRDSIRSLQVFKSTITNKLWINPFEYKRRTSIEIINLGGNNPPVVITDAYKRANCKSQKPFKTNFSISPDWYYLGEEKPVFLPNEKLYIQDYSVWDISANQNVYPILSIQEYKNFKKTEGVFFLKLKTKDLEHREILNNLKQINTAVLVLTTDEKNMVFDWRKAFYLLHKNNIELPVILHQKFISNQNDDLLFEASKSFSPLLLDGFGDGIWIETKHNFHLETLKQISFGILQSCRLRQTETEYIACPSCGRTLFNIEEKLDEIKRKTNHLKHLKIAVMGCFVNGLGEMADADYGYIGAGKSKVNLYKGKRLFSKNIHENKAADALIDLIKAEGDWINP
ncbi:MAG: (E)-4-hydroxy-3-methylbut-2-enyl-diphosphate synthase [Bacteroidota bacterium]